MTGNQGSTSPEDKKNARLGCAVIAVFVLLVGGCVNLMNGDDETKSSASTSVSDVSDGESDASDSESDASESESDASDGESDASGSEGDAITVPDYTGQNLQEAQDAAQRAGIYLLKSRDLSMRERMQVWDRSWQVCEQEPAAGSVMQETKTLTFAVVKTDESCDDPDGAEATGDDDGAEPTDEPTGTGSSATSGGSGVGEGDSSGGSAADGSGSSGSSSSSGGSSSSGSSGSSGSASSSGGTGSEGSGGSASGGEEQPQAPAGASARCNDGTYSYSAHRRGTCSHHHGVAVWLRSLPA
ncbi:DUF3761 domain-containing protein [Streptomyces sp. MCA2]|uniref:DUF3761 domain-containing protein n=1 Tax=Streptomyces sp. MCA2 TaxID=2944805 RepID=UPI0020210245|nr:DUF3761 domain-containing protein [Streptomyces sp. MCA2]MCL7495133.1 DUF3761 domain-containing protein [Streptomyces sp. MCA2]